MSSEGRFVGEEDDIVRLEGSDGSDGLDRNGWINVHVFSVSLTLDCNGNLLVQVYPRTAEHPESVLREVVVPLDQALVKGGKDPYA